MQHYCVGDRTIGPDESDFEVALLHAHGLRTQVRCLCRTDVDLPMYVARRQSGPVLARWPGTGTHHALDCTHFTAPDVLTGLGQVRGSAIIDDAQSGETLLKFGFPLLRGAARAAPAAMTNDKPDVKATPQRLTMRGFLHYLWDRAELTHWHPGMNGKRNWYIVRRQLLQAAHTCKVKGDGLDKVLFVPETFFTHEKEAIAGRRHGELAMARASKDAVMIVIGEIKSIEPARYGEKIVIRHLPDWPFLMDEDMSRRFHKRFGVEEELWRSQGEDGRLIMAASFSIGASGLPQLIEMAVMPLSFEWLPYEDFEERALLTKAVRERRRFVKGLRVNLGLDKPIASITLTDTGIEPTAIHLDRLGGDEAYDQALAALMQTPGVAHMRWKIGDQLPITTRALSKP